MITHSTPAPRRLHFWVGVLLPLLGLAANVGQFAMHYLVMPWYMPIAVTLGFLLVFWSVLAKPSVARLLTCFLLALVTAAVWFLVTQMRLPNYEGPAQAGNSVPAFETHRATGETYSDREFRQGTKTALVFFRGRW